MTSFNIFVLVGLTCLLGSAGAYDLIGGTLSVFQDENNKVFLDYRASWSAGNDKPVCSEIGSGNISLPCFTDPNNMTHFPMNCTDVGRNWKSGRGIATYEPEKDLITTSMFQGKIDLNFTERKDILRRNSPPVAEMIPFVKLRVGCKHMIQIPVGDIDGDVVRCRWSKDAAPSTDITLDKTNCEVTVSEQAPPNIYPLAIQIEDFRKTDVLKPISSIPLHFFVQIDNDGLQDTAYEGSGETDYAAESCNTLDMTVVDRGKTATDSDCHVISVGQTFSPSIVVPDTAPVRFTIDTLKPVGMEETKAVTWEEKDNGVSLTWTPTEFDKNRIHFLCSYAYNETDGLRSTVTKCIRIIVTESDGGSGSYKGLSCERAYPVCSLITKSSKILFLNNTKQSYAYGETVGYKCSTGLKFQESDSKQLSTKCQADGTFEDLEECIQIVCNLKEIGDKNILYLDTPKPPFNYNDTVNYKCKVGFKFPNANSDKMSIKCLEDEMFEPLQDCVRIECKLPDEELWNVDFTDNKTFYYDEVVSYSCMAGYKFNDSAENKRSVKCLDSGKFQDVVKCYPVGCELPDGTTGNVTYVGDTRRVYSYQQTVRYKCAAGFKFHNPGSETAVLRCLKNGFFDDFKKCVPIECSLPDESNLNIEWIGDQDKFGFKDRVEYRCKEGYWFPNRTRGNGTISCQQSENFETPTRCIEIPKCPANVDKRGTTWNVTKAEIKASSKCPAESTGNVTRECDYNGKWRDPYYSCVREEIKQLGEQIANITGKIQNATVNEVKEVVSSLKNLTEAKSGAQNDSTKLTSGEVAKLSENLGSIADALNSSNSEAIKDEDVKESFLKSCDNLIDSSNEDSWVAQKSETDEGAEKVLKAVDVLAEAIGRNLENKTKDTFVKNNFALEVTKIEETTQEVKFPDEKNLNTEETWIKESKSSISLNRESLKDESVNYVTTAVMYRDMSKILPSSVVEKVSNTTKEKEENKEEPETKTRINGPILSMTITPNVIGDLNPPIKTTFEHFETSLANPICSFLDFESTKSGWSDAGCWVDKAASTKAQTVCECNHLTNFAVLMSPFKEVETNSLALEVISILGISVSILCLALTLIIHIAFWKLLRNDRTVILMNLCIALVISSITFLAGINATENPTTCAAVAAFLQYMYLVVFCIMLVEGIVIALTIVLVFKTKRSSQFLLIPAWIVPAVVVGISLGATGTEGYGNKNFCWLSVESGLIWTFVGPALLILVCNVVCLVLVFRAMFKTAAMETKKAVEKVRTSFRCLCVLLPLMGLSWLFGIFNVSEKTVFIQYIFTILNAFQGFFIFLFHCVLNKQVKKAFEVRLRRFSATHPSFVTLTSTLTRSNSKVSKSESSKSEAASTVSRAEEKSSKAGTSKTEEFAMSDVKKEFKGEADEDLVGKGKKFSPGTLWNKIVSRKKQEYTFNKM